MEQKKRKSNLRKLMSPRINLIRKQILKSNRKSLS